MATHAIMSYISFGVAWLCWFSFKFHTVYLIFQIHVAIWNGANAYFSKTRTLIEETNKEAMEKKAAKAAKAAKASGSGNEDNVIPATGR